VLSFGPEGQTLGFEPLNVLIGPNASGKSNLIDCLWLLKSLAGDSWRSFQRRERFRDWLWKGEVEQTWCEFELNWDDGTGLPPLQYNLTLGSEEGRATVINEIIGIRKFPNKEYEFTGNLKNPKILNHKPKKGVGHGGDKPVLEEMERVYLRRDQSILSQLRDVERYPYIAHLADWFSGIRLYRDWVFGRYASAREAQPIELQDEYLEEDAGNLGAVLKRLKAHPVSRPKVDAAIRALYDGITELLIRNYESEEKVTFLVTEESGRVIPASRLSDGTIRYLSLLAILCDPNPAPFVCIEEPELGLHPDLIPTIAELLIDASERTQLIVTTHSADLITALGSVPESVVVCERGIDGTTLKRLEAERLKKWLEKYTLGHLWAMGEIGGNRW
jgi:predicted ATPase